MVVITTVGHFFQNMKSSLNSKVNLESDGNQVKFPSATNLHRKENHRCMCLLGVLASLEPIVI